MSNERTVVVTLPAEAQQIDQTGYVWAFLDEAGEPDRVQPGAVIVAGGSEEPFIARVVDIVDGPGCRSVVHLDMIGVPDRLAVAHLLWPDFVEVRGCVFRAECFEPENFESWWATTDGEVAQVEAVINHLHLWDEFTQYEDSEAVLPELADVLVEMWAAALASTFPTRRFDVRRDDHYGPGVTFSSVQ
jgi:hypothetical protein